MGHQVRESALPIGRGGEGAASGQAQGQPPGVRADLSLLAVIFRTVLRSAILPLLGSLAVILAGLRGGGGGERPALAGDPGQAAGQQGGRGGGDGGRGDRAAGERGHPRTDGPPGCVERADRTGVELLQGGGGGAVVRAAREPGAEPDPVIMSHDGGGLLPDPPSGGGHPPDEVDVLPHEHAVGEPRARRRPADDESSAWHIGHSRARPDDRRARPHVEGRTRPLVPGQPRGPRLAGDNPGRDRADRGVAEVRSSRSSQPGAGTQSQSRNATSSVDAAASPVLRAAPGPPFTRRWITRAPCAAAMAAIAPGSAEASSTTITRVLLLSG